VNKLFPKFLLPFLLFLRQWPDQSQLTLRRQSECTTFLGQVVLDLVAAVKSLWRTGEGSCPDFLPSGVVVGGSSHFGRGAFPAIDLAVEKVEQFSIRITPRFMSSFLDVVENAAIRHGSVCTL
jgi:hypothetical protein